MLQEQILQLHHAGASAQTLAAALNRQGYRTSHNRRWHATSVARIVTDAMKAPSATDPPGGGPQMVSAGSDPAEPAGGR